jgi:Zn-dependent protease
MGPRLFGDDGGEASVPLIDFTLSQLIMRGCAVLFVSVLHGATMTAVACALGDQGPRHDGRLTLDPLRHVDVLGGLIGLIFAIGWAKWVAIDPRELRRGRFDLVLVVVSGFVAILLGVSVLRLLRPLLLPLLPDTAAATAFELIRTTIELGLSFAALSIMPIPPLAGGQLLVAAFPRLSGAIPRVELGPSLILAALIATGVLDRVLDPAVQLLSRLIM